MSVGKKGKLLLYTGIMLAMFLLAVVILFGKQLFPGVWAYGSYYEAVTVEKIWDDAEDPSKRPEAVTVVMGYLDSDGVHSGKSIVLNEENNWSYTFPSSWNVTFDREYAVDGYQIADVNFVSDGSGGYVCKIINSRKYPVSYEWTWEGLDQVPSYPPLPSSGEYGAGKNVEVNTSYKEGTTRKVGDTYYTFSGWDKKDFSMPKEPVVIHGKWTKSPLYQVDYRWEGLPEDATLHDGSKASVPATVTGLPKGEYVTMGYRYSKGTYATAADGTVYQFSGWRAENWSGYEGGSYFYMPGQNVTFVGEWKKVAPHTVKYEWTSDDGSLPTSVYLPSDEKYLAGETVAVDSYYSVGRTAKNFKTGEYYVFSGWRKGAYETEGFDTAFEETFTMPDEDVTIYGCWEKTSAYGVEYAWTWEGLSGAESGLPYLAQDGAKYLENESVYRRNSEHKAGECYYYEGQLYRFSGWTAHKQGDPDMVPFTVDEETYDFNMPGYDLMIEGEWKKVTEQTYNVKYEWTGVSEDLLKNYKYSLSLPEEERPYEAGEEVRVKDSEYGRYPYCNATENNPYMLGNKAFMFTGWREGKAGTPEFNKSYGETFTMPAEDVTLYGSLEELTSYTVEWYEIPSADADVSTAKLMYDRSPNPVIRYAKDGSHVTVKDSDKNVRKWTFVEDYPANVLEADTSLEEPATLKLYFTKKEQPQETYNLTIHYVNENGDKLHGDYTEVDLAEGDMYSVTSPAINGYLLKDADQATISGEMPDHNVEIDVVYIANPNQPTPPTPVLTYTVTYTDGVEDEIVFPDQVTTNLFYGDKTPLFKAEMRFAQNEAGVLFNLAESNQNIGDIPYREGYVFTGWTPAVSDIVTGNAVYTATWKADTTDIGDDKPPLVDVPDEKPPLADVPDEEPPLADTPKEDIPENDVPLSGTPKTGDSSDISLWMLTLAASGAGLVCLLRGLKRRREDA